MIIISVLIWIPASCTVSFIEVYRGYSDNYITTHLDPSLLYSQFHCKYIEGTVIIISLLICSQLYSQFHCKYII